MPLEPLPSNSNENNYNGLAYNYYPLFLSSLYNNKDKSIINSISAQQQLNDFYGKIGVNFYTNGNYTEVTPQYSVGYNPDKNTNINFDYIASRYPFYNLNYTKRF